MPHGSALRAGRPMIVALVLVLAATACGQEAAGGGGSDPDS